MLILNYRDRNRPEWRGVESAAPRAEALVKKARLEKRRFIVEKPTPADPIEDPTK